MKHLKIRTKLLLGFALVSMLTVSVGLVGIFGLMSVNTQYSEMLEQCTRGISSMADIRELYQIQRLTLRGMLIDVGNPEKIQANINSLKENEIKLADALAAYESTIVDPESEQDFYMARDVYLNEYAVVKEKLLAAINAGDTVALSESFTEGGKASDTISGYLQSTINYISRTVASETAGLAQNAATIVVIQIAVMISAAVLAMIQGVYIASLIGKPIRTMSSFFMRFGSTGDLEVSEEDKKNIAANSGNRDETGQCISAAALMVNHLTRLNESLGKIAEGDLTVEVEVLSEKDGLGMAVAKVLDRLNNMFAELRGASMQVSAGAEQIAQSAQELASGSSQQAASIEEFSNSLIVLQEDTRSNAEKSVNAEELANHAGEMIGESLKSMSEMLDAMKEIDESSKSITKVIKVIDDIAFQTNILALNAAVEAARAGLHGKGFAVVADEVRNLASKSAAAAKETAALIEGSSIKVKEGNQIVDKTNASLEGVVISARDATSLLEEVANASLKQADTIKEMNQNIEQISGVVQENSASAEESAAAAEEMSSQANVLDDIIARFKLKASVGAAKSQSHDKSYSVGFVLKPGTDMGESGEKY